MVADLYMVVTPLPLLHPIILVKCTTTAVHPLYDFGLLQTESLVKHSLKTSPHGITSARGLRSLYPEMNHLPHGGPPPAPDPFPEKLYVWSKSGVTYYNNQRDSPRDHMARSHFSGLVDAIDRTRPVGAVGWAGERYSYP